MSPARRGDPAPPTARRWLLILWPAFVMAGVLEALVFAMIDPSDLQWFGAAPVQLSRLAIYSMTFLVFWAAIATAGAITALLEVEEVADRARQCSG